MNISMGITSECKDGKHIYFGDIDQELGPMGIITIVRKLQAKGLSDILVIETTNGFNFIAFDKLSLNEIYNINAEIPDLDQAFNKHNKNREYYTLRIGKDKTFYAYYQDVNTLPPQDNSKSDAHRIFFNNVFNIHIPKDQYFDYSDWFQLVFYEDTKERGL